MEGARRDPSRRTAVGTAAPERARPGDRRARRARPRDRRPARRSDGRLGPLVQGRAPTLLRLGPPGGPRAGRAGEADLSRPEAPRHPDDGGARDPGPRGGSALPPHRARLGRAQNALGGGRGGGFSEDPAAPARRDDAHEPRRHGNPRALERADRPGRESTGTGPACRAVGDRRRHRVAPRACGATAQAQGAVPDRDTRRARPPGRGARPEADALPSGGARGRRRLRRRGPPDPRVIRSERGPRKLRGRREPAFLHRKERPMKVLVTGITGFAGSHLVDYLLTLSGVEVMGIQRWRSRTENIEHFKDKVRLVECDLRDASSVRDVIDQLRPDRIFHLAAQSFVPTSWTAPTESLVTNIIGQLNIFEAVKKLQIMPRIQLACSSEQYGMVYEQ